MQTSKQRLGAYGEDSAAAFLVERGYQIVARNYRSDLGEIDIIARNANWLVFVEVKTRSGGGYGDPFEAITHSKLQRMRRLAAQWTSQFGSPGDRIRLDAISVLLRNGRVLIEHLKQVF